MSGTDFSKEGHGNATTPPSGLRWLLRGQEVARTTSFYASFCRELLPAYAASTARSLWGRKLSSQDLPIAEACSFVLLRTVRRRRALSHHTAPLNTLRLREANYYSGSTSCVYACRIEQGRSQSYALCHLPLTYALVMHVTHS